MKAAAILREKGLAPRRILAAIEAVLEAKRSLVTEPVTIRIAVIDDDQYVIALGSRPIVRRGWTDQADLSLVTNASTLADWAAGRLNVDRPSVRHLLIMSGDRSALRAISDLLGPGVDQVALRGSRRASDKRPSHRKKRGGR